MQCGLVERKNGRSGSVRFIVGIENVFHGGIDLWDASHALAPWADLAVGKPPPHGLAREAFVVRKPNRFVAQRFKRTVGMTSPAIPS